MKDFRDTLSSIYFAKSSDKPHGYYLFAANEAYSGDFDNKIVNRTLSNLDFVVSHQDENELPVKEPLVYTYDRVILIPSKAHFPNEMSYYHILLHEATHGIAHDLKHDKPMNDAFSAYKDECLSNNKPILSMNDLVDTMRTEEGFKNASPAAQNRVLAYLREEVKAEAATKHLLLNLGYTLDKTNEQSFADAVNNANNIAKFAGIDLKHEIADKHSAYSKAAKQLAETIAGKLKEATKELGLEPSNSKSKIHNKDKDL